MASINLLRHLLKETRLVERNNSPIHVSVDDDRTMRPSTLREVSRRVANGEDETTALSKFFDHFYGCDTQSQMMLCFADELDLLDCPRLHALYAAVAEYLSNDIG